MPRYVTCSLLRVDTCSQSYSSYAFAWNTCLWIAQVACVKWAVDSTQTWWFSNIEIGSRYFCSTELFNVHMFSSFYVSWTCYARDCWRQRGAVKSCENRWANCCWRKSAWRLMWTNCSRITQGHSLLLYFKSELVWVINRLNDVCTLILLMLRVLGWNRLRANAWSYRRPIKTRAFGGSNATIWTTC